MNAQEFDKGSVKASKTGGNILHNDSQNRDAKVGVSRIKPPNGKPNAGTSKSEDSTSAEGGKLLRDKHIEERKRKNAERKAAVEDRRKQKEIEDNARHETFRHLLEHKPSSKAGGRKLPSVPNNGPAHSRRETPATRRISSSSSSSEGHTPPESDKGSRNTRRNLTGPTSASTSSLNSFGSTARPRTNLGASKKTSISTNCLNEKSSGAKAGQRGKDKGTGAGAPARRSVGSSIPKAQSMGAIHQVGHSKTSRPPTGKKAKPKAKPTHHAGTSSEAEAGKALAEHRKKMREEAERKALLDKEKQEELRRQREEEEKRLAEENAKEMARQAELAAQLQKQQEERARVLREQREKEAEIEAEKLAAELKRKEEMEVLKRQEMERRAAELERREREEEERLKQEELERQERRKRVEMIMSRTRMTSTVNSNNLTKAESYSSLEDLSLKLSDECHSNTVSEILQKVKEKSRASPSPEKDNEHQKENHQFVENSEKDSSDGKTEISSDVLTAIDNSKHGIHVGDNVEVTQGTLRDSGCNFVDHGCTSRDCEGSNFRDQNSNAIYDGTLRNTSCTLRGSGGTVRDTSSTSESFTYGTSMDSRSSSIDTNCTPNVINGTTMDIGSTLRDARSTSKGSHGTSMDNHSAFNDSSVKCIEGNNSARVVDTSAAKATLLEVSDNHKATKHDVELWTNVENAMLSTDNKVRENLEMNGVSAHEDLDNDEDSEEGQLWTVVEGRRHISEVI